MPTDKKFAAMYRSIVHDGAKMIDRPRDQAKVSVRWSSPEIRNPKELALALDCLGAPRISPETDDALLEQSAIWLRFKMALAITLLLRLNHVAARYATAKIYDGA